MRTKLLFKILVICLVQGLILTNAWASLSITSYNIRNFDYDSRSQVATNRSHLMHIINEIRPDLMGIQEINDTHEFTKMITKYYGNKMAVALTTCGGAHGQRVGFVYNTEVLTLKSFKEDLRVADPNGQLSDNCHAGSRPLGIATFEMKASKKLLVAMSLHFKSGGRDRSIAKRFMQLDILKTVIKEHRKKGIKNFAVMGDFNSTEFSKKGDLYNRFNNVVAKMDMIDTTKDLNCSSYWWGGVQDGKQHPSHLDHILVSKELLNNKEYNSYKSGHCKKLQCKVASDESMGISYDQVSDHCPLTTVIN